MVVVGVTVADAVAVVAAVVSIPFFDCVSPSYK